MAASLETTEGRAELKRLYRAALLDDVVPFWVAHGPDTLHGGFFTSVGRAGELLDDDKSVWFQGRAAWTFATLCNRVERRAEWLCIAQSCVRFLEDRCCDAGAGGHMHFVVSRDGRPLRTRRYAYSESFAAVAHAALFGATGDAFHARRARELFDLFLKWNFEPGVAPPKTTGERPLIGMAPRMITIVTAQELRKYLPASDAPFLQAKIDWAIDEIRRLFVKPDIRCVMEAVQPDGAISDHFDGRMLNPGHAIEGAWFIMQEGKIRGDRSLVDLGCRILDWMWERGWDTQHGGLFYFRDVFGKPVQEYWHDMKFWWNHCEAIIATMLAFQLTGDAKYARWHKLVHDWSFAHFPDTQHGEWFGYLHRDGSVSVDLKGNMWKGPFHLPRMLLYCTEILDEMMKK